MKSKRKKIEPIPDEFQSYKEAAEFWDTHDTTDYINVFTTIDAQAKLRKRHYEVAVDEDVIKALKKKAQKFGVPIGQIVGEMLRKQLSKVA